MLCSYGCGEQANFYSKNSKKWRCQLSPNKCAKMRENNKLSHLGRKEISTESHMRLSEAAKKYRIPLWERKLLKLSMFRANL